MQQTPIETIWMDKLRGLSMEMKYMKDFPYKKKSLPYMKNYRMTSNNQQ